ncbi:MAG: DUF937 domain-containing protein [Bacteroidales bacterium]|nr:DUF937 domain-containing protein [Bacteroidales bacterium]MBN2698711.1 DUF937 domain-containing protein [Bacteroidales bacterium]
MKNILGELLSTLDDNALESIARKTNASPTQAKSALASAIPILMSAMAKNSKTKDGATALQKAVEKDHDGSLLDNLGDFLGNPEAANGVGILRHVLGGKQQNVASYISNDTGLSGESAGKILEIAAPLVMGYLGKKRSTGEVSNVSSLLNTFMKTEKKQAPKAQGVIAQLLDSNNDGNVMDDISQMGMSFLGKMLRRK